jgi:hypothetical protein
MRVEIAVNESPLRRHMTKANKPLQNACPFVGSVADCDVKQGTATFGNSTTPCCSRALEVGCSHMKGLPIFNLSVALAVVVIVYLSEEMLLACERRKECARDSTDGEDPCYRLTLSRTWNMDPRE